MTEIGKRNKLAVVKVASPGFYLDGGERGEILLPGRYIPRGAAPGDVLDVFVYRDSEDRLVATTEVPHAVVGEFARLEVIGVNQTVGAFLAWGLSKDLLLPFREQQEPVQTGDWVIVYIYLDPQTERIVATTRLNRHLSKEPASFRAGQAVEILITTQSPLGYNAIVEGAHRGLLYHDSLSRPLQPGQKLQAFVRRLRPDGKIDLSLDASGYQRVASLTEQIIQELERHGGRFSFDDDSAPESIRDAFGVSKKAFKQALGALYKARRVRFLNPGVELIK